MCQKNPGINLTEDGKEVLFDWEGLKNMAVQSSIFGGESAPDNFTKPVRVNFSVYIDHETKISARILITKRISGLQGLRNYKFYGKLI